MAEAVQIKDTDTDDQVRSKIPCFGAVFSAVDETCRKCAINARCVKLIAKSLPGLRVEMKASLGRAASNAELAEESGLETVANLDIVMQHAQGIPLPVLLGLSTAAAPTPEPAPAKKGPPPTVPAKAPPPAAPVAVAAPPAPKKVPPPAKVAPKTVAEPAAPEPVVSPAPVEVVADDPTPTPTPHVETETSTQTTVTTKSVTKAKAKPKSTDQQKPTDIADTKAAAANTTAPPDNVAVKAKPPKKPKMEKQKKPKPEKPEKQARAAKPKPEKTPTIRPAGTRMVPPTQAVTPLTGVDPRAFARERARSAWIAAHLKPGLQFVRTYKKDTFALLVFADHYAVRKNGQAQTIYPTATRATEAITGVSVYPRANGTPRRYSSHSVPRFWQSDDGTKTTTPAKAAKKLTTKPEAKKPKPAKAKLKSKPAKKPPAKAAAKPEATAADAAARASTKKPTKKAKKKAKKKG